MKKVIVFACMALIFPTILLIAQPRPMMERGHGERIIKMLKLTDDQQKQFKDLAQQFRQIMIDNKAKIEKNRIDLKKMIEEGKVDEKLLVQLTEDNSKLQSEMKSSAVKHWLSVYKILDKEQQEKWVKTLGRVTMMKEGMKEGMKGRMRNFMMHRRPMKENDTDNDNW